MKNILWSLTIVCIIFLFSVWLYNKALYQSVYQGLPTVPCIDPTRSIKQDISFHIRIVINDKEYPLEKNIGHDFGNCIRAVHTDSTDGTVIIEANDMTEYTLGNFFEVWRKTFNNHQLFQYQTTNNHVLGVFVNGQRVTTFADTPLFANELIEVVYQ
jgi:hypothetical protein